jgi:hypothetical protein
MLLAYKLVEFGIAPNGISHIDVQRGLNSPTQVLKTPLEQNFVAAMEDVIDNVFPGKL